MLIRVVMTQIGAALAPITVVLLDTLFVGPDSANRLIEAVRSSQATPFIAWTVALFMGHWFHPMDNLDPVVPEPWNYAVFVPLTAIVGALSFWCIDTAATTDWLPATAALLGFAVGALFWPVGEREQPR